MTRYKAEEKKLLDVFEVRGHKPVLDEEGLPDFSAYSEDDPESFGGHNGPQCSECGYAICFWCWLRYGQKVEMCDGKEGA